jgi:signal transduction histidine kinase
LYSDYLDCNIKFNDSERVDGRKYLYTSSNGGYFTYFLSRSLIGKIEGQNDLASVAIDNSIIHFDVDNTITSLDYILKVLSSDSIVTKQAEYLTRGYGWEDYRERNEALLNIRIYLPSLEEQNAILLADSRKGYADKSEEVQRAFDNFRKNMHMQKHKVGQTISTLATWVNYLELARQRGIKEDSDIVIPAYNTTLGDVYANIQEFITKLRTEIKALDSSYGLERQARTFALADFLDNFCSKAAWPGFEILWDSHPHRHDKDLPLVYLDESDPNDLKAISVDNEYIFREGDPMDYINFPEIALQTILENIIANAIAYGFTDRMKHYQIKFDIQRDGTTIVLFVSNNGQPLHKDMEPAEVFTYGHTSGDEKHSGIGGYQILEYMKAFEGNAEIISTPDEEFTVTYKLTFKDANPSIKIEL